jgi:hypothetical protein
MTTLTIWSNKGHFGGATLKFYSSRQAPLIYDTWCRLIYGFASGRYLSGSYSPSTMLGIVTWFQPSRSQLLINL